MKPTRTVPVAALALALALALAAGLAGCAAGGATPPWSRLVDGASGLANFNRVGATDWSAVDGAIQAGPSDKGATFLVSRQSYRDFMIRAEFWASDDANSGIFMRCQDPGTITDENCYEANIFDQRPDPTYGTGAIVKVARAPDPMPKAGGKWNTYEITARGKHLVLVLNGVKTVDVEDARLTEGPIALQWARGVIKFRKVEIRPL